MRDFFIAQDDFRVFLSDVQFSDLEKSDSGDEPHNSRRIRGAMNTSSLDRQGEKVLAKGLDLSDFLANGHFNDNHDQATSAIVGYPEKAYYSGDIVTRDGRKTDGWICEGYVLKGTSRSDAIWELAKALATTPDKRLGFSIEGKVIRRKDNIVEKAMIRHCAITNVPVNTEATWDVLAKSFCDSDVATKSMMAGYGAGGGPAAQSGGSALSPESLDSHLARAIEERRKKKKVKKALPEIDDLVKAIDFVLEFRPDFTDEAAAELVRHMVITEWRNA